MYQIIKRKQINNLSTETRIVRYLKNLNTFLKVKYLVEMVKSSLWVTINSLGCGHIKRKKAARLQDQ